MQANRTSTRVKLAPEVTARLGKEVRVQEPRVTAVLMQTRNGSFGVGAKCDHRSCFGVSVRRALRTSAWARMSIRPQRVTSRVKLLSACRVSRQREREHSREARVCTMQYPATGEGKRAVVQADCARSG